MATAALLKPNAKVLQAIKDYTVKIDSETISDYPLKATLIYEAIQKYGVSVAVLAEILGKTPETVQTYLNQRIDPNLIIKTPDREYLEINRAKVERQIRSVKEKLNLTYKGGM
jgi:ribosome-binding protein aMBF1 (putative translation factor)